MHIRIITTEHLKDFVETEDFTRWKDVPITPLRAISQFHNPKATPDDPALVIAFNDQEEVIAYTGCLPDQLAIAPEEKICWNSCWWAHPEKGREAAMPVFYKALQLWEGKMLFDGLTPRSEAILRRMKFIHCIETEGVRGFLQTTFYRSIPAKFPAFKAFSGPLKWIDNVLNMAIAPRIYFWKNALSKTDLEIVPVDHIDHETHLFIQQYSDEQLICRAEEALNWILEYPWLSAYPKGQGPYHQSYHFSAHASRLEQRLLKIKQDHRLVAFCFFTYRDGEVKLPYVYYLTDHFMEVFKIILWQVISLQAATFVCFHPQLSNAILENTTPFFYTKKIHKTVGIPDTLKKYYDQTPLIQDGDGDVVFT